jgi:two-component system cell cycle sensor histidine kinase/response regulator CckA
MMGDPVRVLIVEDAPTDAELVERELQRGGLVFETRRVDEEAPFLRALDEFEPHLVLSDFSMPVFDGLRALRLLLERRPDVPLIIVTGSINEETAVRCIQAGAADYVIKEHLGRLVPSVTAALERGRLLREKARAERERSRAQELTQAAIDALPSHLCVVDEAGTIVAVNQAWRAFAAAQGGLASRVGEGVSYLEVCDRAEGPGAEDARAFARGLRDVLSAARAGFEQEYPCPTPDDPRWFIARATEFSAVGARHAVVAHVDITERKKAEERLAHEYALLQTVLDSTEAAFVAVDRDLRYLTFNRWFADRLRAAYGAEASVGAPVLASIPAGAEREVVRRSLERALGGDSFAVETTSVRSGPMSRLFSLSFSPVRTPNGDGDVAGAVVLAQDVTERRQAEDRLRQLGKAVDQSPVSIVITDTEGRIEYVNPGFERVTGYQAAEVLGQNPRLLKSGEMSPEFYGEMWQTILSGREWHGELLNRRKDGSLFWETASISAVRNVGGRITHFVAVKEDVTRRKEQEELLHQTQTQLNLAQKMEAVGRLAGGVAHDFNNLLSVIEGHAERLGAELGAGHAGHARVEQILWSAERAAALTRQLLAFSRRQVLEPRVLRLDTVAGEAQKMLERIIGEDVDLAVVSPGELGHVRADPGQIVQILLNLAVNSRDAMPKGGRLTVEFADCVLDESFASRHPPSTPGPYAMMAVSDTGHGMSAETVSRIFEPFFTTKENGKGTGLGLSTVYGIVKQSGGFIWVYSEPGHGTTFKIYFPRVAQPLDERPAVAEAPRPAPSRSGARILLVEDDAGVRGLMAEILEAAGYVVTVAAHPAEALALVEAMPEPIDLLLTDVIMPGMSGRDLARELAPRRPGLRVLYVSGYAGEAIARHGGIEPGGRFLQKPFSEVDLLQRVAEAVEAGDPPP